MRVLLVDDVPQILNAFSKMIYHKHEVRTAAGVEAARAVLEGGFDPDVVVSDYTMLDGTGLDVLRAVKARCPQARRYIASGSVAGIIGEAHDLADGVLSKGSDELTAFLQSI